MYLKRVIEYFPAMIEYCAILQDTMAEEMYDEFDRAYLNFMDQFYTFLDGMYNDSQSSFSFLINEVQEFDVPLEDSTIQFCLDGLKIGNQAVICFERGKRVERKQIFLDYISSKFNQDAKRFLDDLTERQMHYLSKIIFEVESWEELKSAVENK